MRCDHCHNEYDKAFTISMGGTKKAFDSFECAIAAMAPRCEHCKCAIIGHGVAAADGRMFCCAHCARESDIDGLKDRTQ